MARKTFPPRPLALDRKVCDRDRLLCADHTLAQVELELQALENGDDDLTYLIEVVRYGVQRAIEASDDRPVTRRETETRRSTH